MPKKKLLITRSVLKRLQGDILFQAQEILAIVSLPSSTTLFLSGTYVLTYVNTYVSTATVLYCTVLCVVKEANGAPI
jgi:hypothetical protein